MAMKTMLIAVVRGFTGIKRDLWLAFVALAILAMLGNWLANEFGALPNALVKGDGTQTFAHFLVGLLWLFLFVLISATLYLHRSSLFGTESIASIAGFGGKRALIFFVSTQSPQFKFVMGTKFPITISWTTGQQEKRSVILEGNLLEDVNRLREVECPWNWISLLRGIAPHVGPERTLEHIYLIGSAKTPLPRQDGSQREIPGSYDQQEACREFLEQYLPPDASCARAVITLHPSAVSFENHNQLVGVLRQAIRFLRQEQGIDPYDIVVDVTGGQKPTSIAGASATINQSVWTQYVSTQYPYRVTGYNLRRAEAADIA
jgi:hypothetical protein